MNDQIITVQCECGQAHQFAQAHVGKRAKCPSLGKRFKVPAISSPVEFLHESGQGSNPQSLPTLPPENEGEELLQ